MTRKSESDKRRLVSVMVHNGLLPRLDMGSIPWRGTNSFGPVAQ